MGKLVDKLREVTQASGGGLGFLSPARGQERKPRPAALLVIGGRDDAATLQAAAESGADGVILSGWTSDGTGFTSLIETLRKRNTIWGVSLEQDYSAGTLKGAQEQGATFAVLDQSLAARALFDDVGKLDLVVTVEPPTDELAMLSLRAVNLLPVRAALIDARFTSAALTRLSIADFTRLRVIGESLRFPTLVTLRDAPTAESTKVLVELGADALVLSATDASASAFGKQIGDVIAQLEKTPAQREHEGGALLAGLLGGAGQPTDVPGPSPTPRPRPDKPEREPDEE